MKKVILFSLLIILGLITSQMTPYFSESVRNSYDLIVKNLTLVGLGFIMIHVGLEFIIDRRKLSSYAWDYFVAFTAAAFPWIFCTLYFVYAYQHSSDTSRFNIWTEALLLGRFASPTSAGVLFSMLAAAGLGATWLFQKARILAIFDDLDTIILLIPIKMMIIGFKWEMIILVFVIVALIYFAWKKMHSISLPLNWYWVLSYSVILTVLCELIYFITTIIEGMVPLHLEILLPAFVCGCVLAVPKKYKSMHEFLDQPEEQWAQLIIPAAFMFLIGASMPPIALMQGIGSSDVSINAEVTSIWNYHIAGFPLKYIIIDVIALTFLSNLGKMYPFFCYRKEASTRERLALAVAMFPRGEVGGGVIIISMQMILHLSQGLILIAMLSLTVNLIMTGLFIVIIKKLLDRSEKQNLRDASDGVSALN
jgi:Kef-type K+ transport system membrane component KefB